MSTHADLGVSQETESGGDPAQDVQAQLRDAAGEAQDRLQDAAGEAQDRLQDVAGDIADQAQAAAAQLTDQAHAAAGQAQQSLRDQVDQRSSQVGEQISEQASDLRSVSEALREKGQDRPAQLADRLAGYGEQAGSYLSGNGAEAILADVEDFGRRRPGAFALGALVAGFTASRFLKASSGRRYAARTSSATTSADPSRPATAAGPTSPSANPTTDTSPATAAAAQQLEPPVGSVGNPVTQPDVLGSPATSEQ